VVNLAYVGFRSCEGPYAIDAFSFFPLFLFIKILMTIGLFALIVYAVVKMMGSRATVNPQRYGSGSFTATSGSDALKLLDERYVRGEISDVEYRRIKQNLLNLPET